jgi:hypothetical protein
MTNFREELQWRLVADLGQPPFLFSPQSKSNQLVKRTFNMSLNTPSIPTLVKRIRAHQFCGVPIFEAPSSASSKVNCTVSTGLTK